MLEVLSWVARNLLDYLGLLGVVVVGYTILLKSDSFRVALRRTFPASMRGVLWIVVSLSWVRRTRPIDADAIKRPPGHLGAELLRTIFPKKTYDRVFSQILEDMREEYFAALEEGRPRLAQWRHFQFYVSSIYAAIIWLLGKILNPLGEVLKRVISRD